MRKRPTYADYKRKTIKDIKRDDCTARKYSSYHNKYLNNNSFGLLLKYKVENSNIPNKTCTFLS